MTLRTRQIWRPTGLVAADPVAFGGLFELLTAPRPDFTKVGPIAIIELVGPFDHHEGCFESYDAFKRRFAAAMASECKGVLVTGDSPGGVVDGMLDTAREVRAIADEAKKPFWWYVDSKSTSSAFAQAVAADRVFIPETGLVGSVGIYKGLCDRTARDAAEGERWVIVSSGSLKAIGNEHLPISDEAIAETQRLIDAANNAFYAWVSERRKISPDTLKELAGRTSMGAEAVALGLADEVKTFDEVRALMLSSLESVSGDALTGGGQQMDEKEKALSALKALAESGDPKAAKALKALTETEEEPPKEEKKEEKKEAKAEEKTPAEPPKEEKKEEAKASVNYATLEARISALETGTDAEKKQALFAARSDLTEEFKASISGLPFANVKEILSALPVGARPLNPVAAARAALGTANPTKTGHDAMGGLAMNSDPRFEKIDQMFGIKKEKTPLVELKGTALFLNPGTPAQAAALLNDLEAGKDVLL